MNKKDLKVAVIYNEPNPELYVKSENLPDTNLNFTPYFEVDGLTPLEEYEILAQKLTKMGYPSYTLNITDSLEKLLDDIKINKPDVVFNFIEIFKENALYEMNIVGLFELMNVAYTGAPPMALANCQSKISIIF